MHSGLIHENAKIDYACRWLGFQSTNPYDALCKQEIVRRKRDLAMHNNVVAWTKRDRAFMSGRIKGRDAELTEIFDAQSSHINVVGPPI